MKVLRGSERKSLLGDLGVKRKYGAIKAPSINKIKSLKYLKYNSLKKIKK
jgi:hypothetical protein